MLEFLSPAVPISKSFYLIPRIAGAIVACWPKPKRTWLRNFIFLISLILVTGGGWGEIAFGFVHLADLPRALEGFCPGITKSVCTFKMLKFFWYPKPFLNIVKRMREMLMNDTNDDKREIVAKLASFASRLSFFLLFSGSMTNALFNAVPLVNGCYRLLRGSDFPFQLPFNMLVPSQFEHMPLYPLTYVTLTLSGATTVFTFSTVDGFFVCSCMYTCALFRMLQYDIRQLFDELRTCERATVAQNIKYRNKLGDIIKRHNAIINLRRDFTAEFTIIVMMHFVSAALIVCLTILNSMLNFGHLSMFIYLSYTLAALTELFLYCIGGNYVSESSLEVAATLYDIDWYKCDARTRKMILMMLRRSQKAESVAVPFFTPSLEAFGSILSTTGSYITLLNTFL